MRPSRPDGRVYWYFKSKDEIVQAIMRQMFQSDLASLEILLDAEAPARARLEQFAARYAETYRAYAWLDAAGIQFYAEAAHDPEVRGFIQEYLGHYRQALVKLIEQGVARGEFRAVVPADVANVILGLEEGLSLLQVVDPQGLRWRQAFAAGLTLLLDGLLASHGDLKEA